ncbi:MAG: hypothetical protein JNM07_13680 [Phycisphaerae bacterium]|nr:hypothetical protein [Phycisphaerae bacterium]
MHAPRARPALSSAIVALSLAATASTVRAQGAPPRQYYITDIGFIGGDTASAAYHVNDYGQVVGYSGAGGNYQPFLWQPVAPNSITGSIHAIGTFGGASGAATSINRYGQVSGYSTDSSGNNQMFLWSPTANNWNTTGGSMHQLGSVGYPNYWPTGINDSGQVAGSATSSPVLWTPNTSNGTSGTTQILPVSSYGSARALNNGGEAAGHMAGYGGTYQAVRYTPGSGGYTYKNIGDVLGSAAYGPGAAEGVNDNGIVTGSCSGNASGGQPRAFLWNSSDQVCTIYTPNLLYTAGNDANELGAAVGYFSDAPNVTKSYLYEGAMNGGMTFDPNQFYDLQYGIDPSLGWNLLGAFGINNAGQICGYGVLNGATHAYLLTPVPAPGPALLLGLGALAAARRRRAGSPTSST